MGDLCWNFYELAISVNKYCSGKKQKQIDERTNQIALVKLNREYTAKDKAKI